MAYPSPSTVPSRYHPLLVVLHWGLAIFILAALGLGAFKMAPLPNTDPMKSEALRAHMTGGLIILGLMVLRLITRRAPRSIRRRPRPARPYWIDWLVSLTEVCTWS